MTVFDPANALSMRTSGVQESAILMMAQKARELKATGAKVISLTIGEPDFETPENIRRAATEAMDAGFTHYAPIPGYPELRAAIAAKLNEENGIPVTTEGVVLSNGAKQALTNTCFATLDTGDEAILLSPHWAAYDGIVEFAGGKPVRVHADATTGFKPQVHSISEAMNSRTKLIFLNSPSNPSGAVWTEDELADLARVVRRHPRCLVVADEIYEYIWFDTRPASMASLPGMFDRTVTVNGFSKGFAMTGWRVGYSASTEVLAKAIAKVQGTFTAGGNAFAQQGALEAVTGPRDRVEAMRQSYLKRRDLAVSLLSRIKGFKIVPPPATFYVMPDISALLGKTIGNTRLETDVDFCHWLLDDYHVATVPGSAFGGPGCIRLSFAASEQDISEGINRIADAATRLRSAA
jgi:aspartate aminotransferase